MSMLDWAEREIEIACKRENPDREEGEWDYGCACYESALKAFKSLLEDGHSGFSIGLTKNILNRLIDGKPLTPIEDTDDVWDDRLDMQRDYTSYQCKRMSSLFKDVYNDGRIEYHDNDRVVGFDIGNPDSYPYYNGLNRHIVNEMYPITMPYIPFDKPFEVYNESFLVDKGNGDFDTKGILYLIKPDGEKVDINRYFRLPKLKEKDTYCGWVEISKEEYEERKARKIDRG